VTEQYTPVAPAAPERKRGIGKYLAGVAGALIVIAIVAVVKFGFAEIVAFVTGAGPAKAKVGDCISQSQDPNEMKVVDCAAAEAAYKVTGVVEGKTKAEAVTSCEPYPTAENYLFQWEGSKTATDQTMGRVLCLESNPKS
jgi:hypothetical protein